MSLAAMRALLSAGLLSFAAANAQTPSAAPLFYNPFAPQGPALAQPGADLLADEYPDLGRILQLDASAEARLRKVLVRHAATSAADSPQSPEQCMRQIAEIAGLLDARRLEDYLDYRASLEPRREVRLYDRDLQLRLSSTQQDRMTVIVQDWNDRRNQIEMRFAAVKRLTAFNDPTQTRAQLAQRRLAGRVAVLDWVVERTDALDREALARLTPVLTAAQAGRFAAELGKQADEVRQEAHNTRTQLGVGAEQHFELPIPVLDSTIGLAMVVTVDGSSVREDMSSQRGAAVTVSGPAGLSFVAIPYLVDEDELHIRLSVYESSRRQPRLVGTATYTAPFSNPRRPARALNPVTQQFSACGRRGYAISWSARATYR